jgi:hypothetical protein
VVVLLVAGGTAASAQAPPPVLDPPDGPPGSVLTISGSDCAPDRFGAGTQVQAFVTDANGATVAVSESVDPATDGTWMVAVTIPSDVPVDSELAVAVTCNGPDSGTTFDAGTFGVEAPQAVTTTTTSPAPDPGAPPAAPPPAGTDSSAAPAADPNAPPADSPSPSSSRPAGQTSGTAAAATPRAAQPSFTG